MPGAGVRALARDVFFYDLRDPSTLLGGLVLSSGVTNANFYSMIDIVLVISSTYFLQDDNSETLPRDSQPLLPGNYFIVADSAINITDEVVVTRTESLSTGTRIRVFKDQVRERDKRCVITKTINPRARFGMWGGFETAHIFPLAYERYWIDNNFSRWISLPPSQGGTINSVQNGLLLRADIRTDFDHFYISINPDDSYKIICFQPDVVGIAGTFLDRQLLDDERRPVDELLRWHFRQTVLANMRGAGEPIFEHDFPPGSDIMRDIRDGPKAAERMEFELFGRLGAHMELSQREATVLGGGEEYGGPPNKD